ncbi:hypothetical protein D9Q98_001421 [Chlorella vulgaris]|uniref:CID domain-containing protein n=1 Tax=Chlorella vulgaris TaxID=3077 RepID=A0A9D4U000_CHLVU|nr:hypothetical protein D9Q98_001421 [Chlorella vulgaris]
MAGLSFLQGGPAPPFAAPPPDAELVKRINTLASYAQRNGISFVQMMAERQGSNPEFSFLAGGLGHEYYAWALYCGLKGLNVSKPPPPSPAAAPPAAAPPAAAVAPPPRAAPPPQDTSAVLQGLPAEVSSGWQTVLGMLSGSRDSIQNSQAWFMACAPYAAGMAELMLQHVLSHGDYQRQLHVIYLANDILFKALSQRPEGSGPDADSVAAAFRPRLGRVLRHALVSGGQTPDVQQTLLRVVNFWAERGVYSQQSVEQLNAELLGTFPPAAAAAPHQHALAALAHQPPPPSTAAQASLAAASGAAYPGAAYPGQVQQHPQQAAANGSAPAAGSWDVAAAARAAAAAIAKRIGGADPLRADASAQHAPQQPSQQQWGSEAAQQWGQQPPPQQQQQQQQQWVAAAGQAQAQFPGQHPAVAAYPGPPPPDSYYSAAAMAAQSGQPMQQQQQAAVLQYGHGGPPAGAWNQQAHPVGPHGSYAQSLQQPHMQQQQFAVQPGMQPPPPRDGFFPPHHSQPPPPGPFPGANPSQAGGSGFPYQPPPPGAFAQPPVQPPSVAEAEGFDPCSFPPGLIPQLVEEKLKTDPPYAPLSPLDIEAAGVPPPPEVDDYLKSRLDKFYAQMGDYRPGMLYSDIEIEAAPRSKQANERGGPLPPRGPPLPPSGPELPHAGLGLATIPSLFDLQPVDDGSFGGTPGMGGAGPGGTGLGYGSARREEREQRQKEREERQREADEAAAAAGEPPREAGGEAGGGVGNARGDGVDVFSSYRHQRSKGYHQMIVTSAAKRWNPKGF